MSLKVDQNYVSRLLRLNTSNVSDALDRYEIKGAASRVLPLWNGVAKIAGPVMTLKLVPKKEGMESSVMDTLRAAVAGGKGSILLIDNGGRDELNSYGGIAATTSRHYGVVGCVSDGAMRDVDEYKALNFPCYARSIMQRSIRNFSSSAGYNCECEFSGIKVKPGDWVLADDNGVVIIPVAKLEAVVKAAEVVRAVEEQVIKDVCAGREPVEAHLAVNYDSMLKQMK